MLKYFFSISWWRRFRASCKPIIRDGTLGFSELGVFFSNLSRDSTLASTKIGHCAKTESGRTTLVPASLVPAVFFHNLSGQGELQDPWSGVVRRDSKWRGAPMPCRGRPPRIQKLAEGRDCRRLQSVELVPGIPRGAPFGLFSRPGSASPCKAEGSASLREEKFLARFVPVSLK